MAKFKIKVTTKEKFERGDDKGFEALVRKNLALYPEYLDSLEGLDYGLWLELNNIHIVQRTSKDDIREDAAFFYSNILRYTILNLLNGKEDEYGFIDGPFYLTFKPIDKKEVLITFDWDIGSTYFPTLEDKREQLKDVPVPFDECIEELYNAGDEFINQLLEINPKLAKSKILKEFIEARDKAKKAIIEYKQKYKQEHK